MRQKKTEGQTDIQIDTGTVTQMLDGEKYNFVSFVTQHSNAFSAPFLRCITYEGRNIWFLMLIDSLVSRRNGGGHINPAGKAVDTIGNISK